MRARESPLATVSSSHLWSVSGLFADSVCSGGISGSGRAKAMLMLPDCVAACWLAGIGMTFDTIDLGFSTAAGCGVISTLFGGELLMLGSIPGMARLRLLEAGGVASGGVVVSELNMAAYITEIQIIRADIASRTRFNDNFPLVANRFGVGCSLKSFLMR